MEDLKTQVVKILDKYVFDKKLWSSTPDHQRITDDLKINSARIVDIVIDIEETFNIEVDNKTLERIKTVNDIITIIQEKQNS